MPASPGAPERHPAGTAAAAPSATQLAGTRQGSARDGGAGGAG